MDPNELLREIRRQIEAARSDGGVVDAERFFECVEALDEWLSKGGFLPDAWISAGVTACRDNGVEPMPWYKEKA